MKQAVIHKGFHRLPCEVCQRPTWHYNEICSDHTPWPSKPRVDVRGAITILGRLGSSVIPPLPVVTPRLPEVKGGLRVRRGCGHWSKVQQRILCGGCRAFLGRTECVTCAGYVIPLPPCACQRSYALSDRGEIVTWCGVCHVPTKPLDLARVAIGRWGKVLKAIGHDVSGEILYEEKWMPLIRQVPGCPACAARYQEIVKVTPEGKTAFLSVGDV